MLYAVRWCAATSVSCPIHPANDSSASSSYGPHRMSSLTAMLSPANT